MKVHAAVLTGIGTPLEVLELDYRDPEPHEVVVRTTAAPFCATDWLGWRGMRNKKPPVVLGHTAVGVIETVGTAIDDLSPGQRVLVGGTPECGRCFYCGIGRPDQCSVLFDRPEPTVARLDTTRAVLAGGRVGAYASHMLVDRNQVWAVETELPDEVASLIGCGVLTGHGAVVNVARVQPGQSVAVVGLGHVGQWMVQAAAAAGAERIIAIDPVAVRRAVALASGATDEVDPTATDPVLAVRALTEGRGADVVLEAAGPEVAVQQAVSMSRRAGTVVLSGVQHFTGQVSLRHLDIAIHGRSILSCQNGQVSMSRDLPRCLQLLEAGTYDPTAIITTRYSLAQANEALHAAGEYRDFSGVFTDFTTRQHLDAVPTR